jgi:hypothetical protein
MEFVHHSRSLAKAVGSENSRIIEEFLLEKAVGFRILSEKDIPAICLSDNSIRLMADKL